MALSSRTRRSHAQLIAANTQHGIPTQVPVALAHTRPHPRVPTLASRMSQSARRFFGAPSSDFNHPMRPHPSALFSHHFAGPQTDAAAAAVPEDQLQEWLACTVGGWPRLQDVIVAQEPCPKAVHFVSHRCKTPSRHGDQSSVGRRSTFPPASGWRALELSWGALQSCGVRRQQLKPLLQAALQVGLRGGGVGGVAASGARGAAGGCTPQERRRRCVAHPSKLCPQGAPPLALTLCDCASGTGQCTTAVGTVTDSSERVSVWRMQRFEA